MTMIVMTPHLTIDPCQAWGVGRKAGETHSEFTGDQTSSPGPSMKGDIEALTLIDAFMNAVLFDSAYIKASHYQC